MIKANFNTYNTYVTDSLYQWDVNQDLVINGLNLSVAPEIHFANANMDKAIVRQSTVASGVVTVRIPNSLLQVALTIKAYVGIYEGDTFKVIETIEIPVIAKAKPADYVFEDTDGEIYSFNKWDNEIVNAKKEIADICEVNRVEMVATINKSTEELNSVVETAVVSLENSVAETTNVLNARVDNIIAHNNDTEGNTELIDIRTGIDGTVYESAGDAVRKQINANLNYEKTEEIPLEWYRKGVVFEGGNISYPNNITDSTSRLLNIEETSTENDFDITGKTVRVSVDNGYKYACILYKHGATEESYGTLIVKDYTDWKYYTESTTWVADGDYKYLLIMLVKTDNSEILLTDSNAIKIENVVEGVSNGVKERIELLNENKVDKSNLAQTLGNGTDKVMSQKAVTDLTYHFRGLYSMVDNPIAISTLLAEGYYNISNINLAPDVPSGENGSAILRNEVLSNTLICQTLYILRSKIYFRVVRESQVDEWTTVSGSSSETTSLTDEMLYNFGNNSLLGELARGTWNSGGLNLDEDNYASLNNYITLNCNYFRKAIIYLSENVLVKVVKVNESGEYLSDSGWFSVNPTDYTEGGVSSYEIVDSYVYIAFADTSLNDTSNYTISASEMLSRIKLVSQSVKTGESSGLSGKKWLFIGDSITEHNFRATKNYDEYLQDWLNITPVNVGMSGTGVTYPYGGNPSWLDKMEEYPADIDVISVMGALNDRHTSLGAWGDRGTDTVYGAVWNYFNNLITMYPNKPIIYITSTPREYSYGVDGEFTAWVDAFIKTAHNFSIPVLDLYRNSGLRPWNATNNAEYFSCADAPTGDGVHPNEKGQRLIALKIAEFAEQFLTE